MCASLARFGCYWRKESGVKLRKLLGSGDFIHDGLRHRARIDRSKNRPANHEEVRTRANCFAGSCRARLIVSLGCC